MKVVKKVCKICGKHDKQEEFCRYQSVKKGVRYSGYWNRCKECQNKKNREARKAADQKALYKYQEKYNKKNPEKIIAQQKLNHEVKMGRMERPNYCSECDCKSHNIEAHHPNYSKPLDVVWLCQVCHRKTHKEVTFV